MRRSSSGSTSAGGDSVAPDGSPPVVYACLVSGCHGGLIIVRGNSRSFSGVSEPGHVLA